MVANRLAYAVSGRVSKVSEQAVIEGSLLVFYPGEWTDDGHGVRSMLLDK
jgi:hypothetical protein